MPIFKISEQLLASLPAPIAIPARRFDAQQEPRLKLLLMVDTIETVFKFGSAIAIREFNRHKSSDRSEEIEKVRKFISNKLPRPSLGDHTKFIESICAVFDKPLPPLVALIKPLVDKKLSDGLVSFRNLYKGHGAVPEESISETVMEQQITHFNLLLERAAAIQKRFPLVPAGTNPTHWMLQDSDGSYCLDLYPLFLTEAVSDQSSIIYNGRKGDKGSISYLNYFSGESSVQKSTEPAAAAFNNEFPEEASQPASCNDFRHFIKDRADSFVGRTHELVKLRDLVDHLHRKPVIISATLGQGKTSLLCKWLCDLKANAPQAPLVVQHFIMEGDDGTCSTMAIFRSLSDQLAHAAGKKYKHNDLWKAEDRQREFNRLLEIAAQKFSKIVVLIDGLDESERYAAKRNEERILHWLPSPELSPAGVRWVLSMRPEFLKDEAFCSKYDEDKAVHFTIGKLDANSIRAILSESANWRVVALREDLIEQVLDKSEGSPLYVCLLGKELDADNVEFTEAVISKLPQGLSALYRRTLANIEQQITNAGPNRARDEFEAMRKIYRKLVTEGHLTESDCEERMALEEQQLQKNLLAPLWSVLPLLAEAAEPITCMLISHITGMDSQEIQRTLTLLGSVLEEVTSPDSDGKSAFRINHSALRDFLIKERQDEIIWAQSQWVKWCLDPTNRRHGYTIRHGVTHLFAAYREKPTEENAAQVAGLLTDIGFITTKVRAGLVAELLQDYRSALEALPGGSGNRFLDLEPLDEGNQWVMENRIARLAGEPVPHPGRGGELVLAAISERKETWEKQRAAQSEQRRLENIAAGRDPEDYGLDFDFDDAPSTEVLISGQDEGEPSAPEDFEQTLEERIAEGREALLEYKPQHIAEDLRQRERAVQIVRPKTATDRVLDQIKHPEQASAKHTPVSAIAEFDSFVSEHWDWISHAETDVAALCANYRSQGSVREAGIKFLDSSVWLENLYPKQAGLQRMKLRFNTFDCSPDTGAARPFDNFRKVLAVSRPNYPSNELVFEFLDVATNHVITTLKIVFEGKLTSRSRMSDCGYLWVTDDGRFARYWNLYFEIFQVQGAVRQINPTDLPAEVSAFLGQMPVNGDFAFHRDSYRFLSNDGALAFLAVPKGGVWIESKAESLPPQGLSCFLSDSGWLSGFHNFSHFAVAGNGQVVVLSNEDRLLVFDFSANLGLLRISKSIRTFAITQDGKLLATASEGLIEIWDVYGGSAIKQFVVQHFGEPMHFSAAGELLYVGGEIVDLRTGPSSEQAHLLTTGGDKFPGSERFVKIGENCYDALNCLHPMERNAGPNPLIEEGQYLLFSNGHLTLTNSLKVACAPFDLGGYWVGVDPHFEAIARTRHAEDDRKWPHHGNGEFLALGASSSTGQVLLASTNGFMFLLNPADGAATQITQRPYLESLDGAVGQPYLEDPNAPEPTHLKFTIAGAILSDDGLHILTATNWDALRIWSIATGECERMIPLPRADKWQAGHVSWLGLSEDGQDCLLGLCDGSLYRLMGWTDPDASWVFVHKFDLWWTNFGPLGNRRYVCAHSDSVSGQGGDGWSYSHEACNIYDLETGVSFPTTGPKRFSETGMPLAIIPDQQHVVVHSVITDDRWGNTSANYLRVLRLRDFEEVMRFPLKAGVKAVSNIASDGRFAVLTESGELLRLQLHLG